MKKLIYLFLTVLIVACSSDDSATDEFNQANGNVQVKLIQSISIVSAQDSQENKNISFSYTSDGFLNTLSDGIDTSIFVYDDNDDLSNITGGGGGVEGADLGGGGPIGGLLGLIVSSALINDPIFSL